MKGLRSLLASLLLICLLASGAAAAEQAALLPQFNGWIEQETPMEVLISMGELRAFMPFDAQRTKDLANLLNHTHLHLAWKEEMGEVWYQGKLVVEDRETLAFNRRDYAGQSLIQLSAMPGVSYSTMVPDPWGKLMGESFVSSWGGLDDQLFQWLPQMESFLSHFRTACASWRTEKTTKKRIKYAGTAALQETYAIPKEDAEAFQRAVSGFETSGPLSTLLKTMQFSGAQKVVMLLTKDGEVISVSYTGNCGSSEDDLRKVKLTWKLGRGENTVMDDFSMKAPAVKGKNGLSADFSRLVTTEKKQRKMTVSLDMDVKTAEGRVQSSMEAALTAKPQGDADQVTGKIELLTQQDKSKSLLTIEPKLQVDQAVIPGGSGEVAVEYRQDGRVLTDMTLALTIDQAESFPWDMATETIDLDRMDQYSSAQETQKISTAVTKAVLPHLILLPKEDTLFLSRGLSDDVWDAMVEAAKREVP